MSSIKKKMDNVISQRLFREGNKRILSLDGGGVRGIVSLSFLAQIESMLRDRTGNSKMVLSDYFDLIGGTSTGAIIAAALAKGYETNRLVEIYLTLANEVFRKKLWRRGALIPRYSHKNLEKLLSQHFGGITLGDQTALKTGLAIVVKRWDTVSPWVVNNNPNGEYFSSNDPSDYFSNNSYPLDKVIRASTAAPSFFGPQTIQISSTKKGAFIDGGLTPHNNPALQLFMLVTQSGYKFDWNVGVDNLLIVSVGAGSHIVRRKANSLVSKISASNAITSLKSVMQDADSLNQTMMQWMGNTDTGKPIDRLVGKLSSELLCQNPLFTYQRYDIDLQPNWLLEFANKVFSEKECRNLHAMDNPANVSPLKEIADIAAKKLVETQHFPEVFDIE